MSRASPVRRLLALVVVALAACDPPTLGELAGHDAARQSGADRTYILWYRPDDGSRLERAVQAFLDGHRSGNLASRYPPHVSLSDFFPSALSRAEAGDAFRRAVADAGGVPFGQPTVLGVRCRLNARRTSHVVDLQVKLSGERFQRYRTAAYDELGVPKDRQRSEGSWHVSLYEAPVTAPSAGYDRACADAQERFAGKDYAHGDWRAAILEQTVTGVTEVTSRRITSNPGGRAAPASRQTRWASRDASVGGASGRLLGPTRGNSPRRHRR